MSNVYPGADLSGQDLFFKDLSNLDLRGCNFSRAILRRCDLHKAKLDGAIFAGADLQGATLDESHGVINADGANFSGASMVRADLERSWLAGAKLQNTQLSGASLSAVNFDRADLSGADLSYARLHDEPSLYSANLTGASLAGAYISGATFGLANLSGVDLQNAKITSVDLQSADLTGAIFVRPETLPDLPEPKSVRTLNKHAMYRAYQELLEALHRSRLSNATHPEGRFNREREWIPMTSEGSSARQTKGPTKSDKMAFYDRCRSKIHCRSLIFSGLDGEAVPADVTGVIDRSVEILQARLACSEDLARALIMTLKNSDMRASYGV